jgi:hypothetical protein
LVATFFATHFAKAQTTSIVEKTKNMTAYNGYKLFIGMKVRVRYGFKLMNLIKNFYIKPLYLLD